MAVPAQSAERLSARLAFTSDGPHVDEVALRRTQPGWPGVVHQEVAAAASTCIGDLDLARLLHVRYRVLDSELGRWTTHDPLGDGVQRAERPTKKGTRDFSQVPFNQEVAGAGFDLSGVVRTVEMRYRAA